jgi:diamine N-acetyltransferase
VTTGAPVHVELRDIETDEDFAAVFTLRRGPGQDRYLGMMISHFEDSISDAHACPRYWSVHDGDDGTIVGFVMISDGIPAETLAARDDTLGPYYLWRLLIDERYQGRGYGAATIDAVAAYVRGKPDGDVLLTSCAAGDGSPQPFYLHYGFTKTGKVMWGEDVLSLDLRKEP